MSEKSVLRSTSDSAESYYGRYRKAYRLDGRMASMYARRVLKLEEASLPHSAEHDLELARSRAKLAEAENYQGAEKVAQAAGWDFERRPAAYHDVAVIDAYIDGAQINVEEPIVIGQRPPGSEK